MISDDSHFKKPAAIPTRDNYKRNYQGAPSGVVVNAGDGPVIVAAAHGENKNEQLSPYVYQNGITNKQPATACLWPDYGTPRSGNCTTNGSEHECGQDRPWFANDTPSALCNYYGFIDGDTSPALSAGNNYGEAAWSDLGPIIWPAKGYVDGSGDPASRGVRHPFLFQPGDGFLYLYYLDTTPGSWGIKVARSPERALGAVGSWTNYDAADGQWDLRSVPKGLSISNYNDYLSTDGPPASNLWGDDGPDTVPMTFQVARLTGLPGYRYIGVEESVGVATSTIATPYPYTGVTAECPAIRLSSDLVHWTPPQCIPTDTASSYVGWYPVLLSSDGSSDQTVAASGFYVVSGQDSTPYIQPVKIAPASAPQGSPAIVSPWR